QRSSRPRIGRARPRWRVVMRRGTPRLAYGRRSGMRTVAEYSQPVAPDWPAERENRALTRPALAEGGPQVTGGARPARPGEARTSAGGAGRRGERGGPPPSLAEKEDLSRGRRRRGERRAVGA